MREWVKWLDSVWDASLDWVPYLIVGAMAFVLLSWWDSLIKGTRERLGADARGSSDRFAPR